MRGLVSVFSGGLVLVVAAVAGCYNPLDDDVARVTPESAADATDPGANGETTGGSAGGGGEAGAAARGLPCDVDAVLEAKCRSCHGSPLMAPMPLVTYEDLAAPSKSDPSKTTAAAAIERMKSEAAPMPPSGDGATASEIAAFEAWASAGLPKGTCAAPDDASGGGSSGGSSGTSSTPPKMQCSSGRTWSGREGPSMNPGRACISCHLQEEGKPIVRIGGTVYPTLLEPDMCEGVNGGATVEITGADGQVFSLPVGPTGNFSLRSETVVMPFTAKVIRADGKERRMHTPQSTGDCNSCHAEKPLNGAPGRIMMP